MRTDLRTRLSDRADLAVQLAAQGLDAQRIVDGAQGDGIQVEIVDVAGTRYGSTPTGPGRGTPGGQPGPGNGPPVPDPAPASHLPIVQDGDLLLVEQQLPDGDLLRLAADESYVSDTLTRLRVFLLVGGLLTLALAALALGGVVGRALQPLDAMTGLARSITHGNRGERLRPDRATTELGRTAAAFDEMLDELEGAERGATRAELGMRDLLADVAHELRTPLTGLQAAAEAVLTADQDAAARQELATALVRESQRAARLVDDLLAVARIDGGLELRREVVDLRELAEEAVGRARLGARAVDVRAAGPSVALTVDRERLAQVLTNLVDNAVRVATTVDLRWGTDGPFAVLDVVDNGPGVPEADRERIFHRLVRLDQARTRDTGGAGLGLPIARGLARAHGGDLDCLPTDRGALFRLTLPLPDPPPRS